MILVPFFSRAQFSVAPIFSDHMVLQQNKPIKIWGKGVPKERITIEWLGKSKTTFCSTDSSWFISFPAQNASITPHTMVIKSKSSVHFIKDVLIGDVWLCIGQSNMEWPMQKDHDFKEALAHSVQPLLRFFNPTYAGKNIFNAPFSDSVVSRLTPEKFYQGKWESCDSNSIRTMSAVAYYFGQSISTEKNMPIGLIHLSIGGAPLETFIDPKALAADPTFASKINGNWLFNNALPQWIKERGMQNVGSIKNVPEDVLGKNHAFKPGFAYAAGIEPIVNFPIAGIVNYQGESNAQEIERVNEYAELTVLMVKDFRKKWKDTTLPFYFVQLSSIDTIHYKGQLWPAFRNAQRTILDKLPYSGMAVTTDVGAPHDVHPTYKKIVGQRLARWALNKTPSGPLPIKATWKDGTITVTFAYVEKGLSTLDGSAVRGFSVDGKTTVPAILSADHKTILININVKPDILYYGWKPFSDANLCNAEGLPASTFMLSVQ